MAFKRLISFVILLFMLATSVSPVALAEVGELDYNNDNLNKTESDGDATGNDGKKDSHWWEEIGNGIGDAFNKGREFLAPLIDTVRDMGDVIAGGWDRFTDWSSDTWNDFSNWSQDTWSSFTDWSANTWDSFTDWSANTWDAFVDGTVNTWNAFTNFTSNVWDATPNWVKSTLSFVGVGAGIVGAVALGVISAPVAIAAGIGAGIAGGAYYLMNRNSDYSFLGSLGWTAGGALLGGIGQATGALAAAGRGLLSLGRAGWSWSKGKLSVLKSNIVSWSGAAWSTVRTAYSATGTLARVYEGAAIGSGVSLSLSVVDSIISGEFSIQSLIVDTISGGIMGGVLAPAGILAGGLISAGKYGQFIGLGIPLSGIGGLENYVVEGIKGDWSFVDNFTAGVMATGVGYSILSQVSKKIFSSNIARELLDNPSSTSFYEEFTTKYGESEVKKFFKDLFETDRVGKDHAPKSTEINTPQKNNFDVNKINNLEDVLSPESKDTIDTQSKNNNHYLENYGELNDINQKESEIPTRQSIK